jgi:hypothetical protein
MLALMLAFTSTTFIACDNGDDDDTNKVPKPEQIATDSLVAYFPFDGDAVDKVSSLTPTASPNVTYKTGRRNNCYQGATDAYVLYDLAATSKLATMTKGFTIGCWLNAPKVFGTPVPKIFEIGNSENLYWGNICWMQERYPEAADSCYFKFHLQATSGEVWATNTAPELIAGRWAYYVITYDGTASTLKIYKDGALVSKLDYQFDNTGDLLFLNPTKMIIGGWLNKVIAAATDEWMGWFEGNIDELRIYDKPFSAARAKNLYDAEVSVMTE